MEEELRGLDTISMVERPMLLIEYRPVRRERCCCMTKVYFPGLSLVI